MIRACFTTFIVTAALAASASLAGAQDYSALPAGKGALSAKSGLILVRDTRAAMGGGGGGYNKGSCWKGCFEEYNNCVDQLAKDFCVPQMKSCLAVCDSMSGGN
jgi:hypothetical protein